MQKLVKFSLNNEDYQAENDHNIKCDPFYKQNILNVLRQRVHTNIIYFWIKKYKDRSNEIIKKCMKTGNFHLCFIHILNTSLIKDRSLWDFVLLVPLKKRLRFVEWAMPFENKKSVPPEVAYEEKRYGEYTFKVDMDIVRLLHNDSETIFSTVMVLDEVFQEKECMEMKNYLDFLHFYLSDKVDVKREDLENDENLKFIEDKLDDSGEYYATVQHLYDEIDDFINGLGSGSDELIDSEETLEEFLKNEEFLSVTYDRKRKQASFRLKDDILLNQNVIENVYFPQFLEALGDGVHPNLHIHII